MAVKIKSPSLNVTLAGVEFRSPFGLSAIGGLYGKGGDNPKVHAEILLKGAEAGAGYIYVGGSGGSLTKATLAKLEEMPRPQKKPDWWPGSRAVVMRVGGVPATYRLSLSAYREQNEGAERSHNTEELLKILQDKKPKDVRIIGTAGGLGDLPDSYVDGAKRCEQLGVDLIQINFSCPSPPTWRNAVDECLEKRFSAREAGALISEHPDLVEEITRAVVKAVKIPVGVKLSPETGFPRVVRIARSVRNAGAKWIESVNMGTAIAPPDIYHGGKPLWPFVDCNPWVQIHGSWLRPICHKHVAAIAKFVPGIDIAATGGLMTPEHCIEVMMLGARLAQLCTAVIEKGNNFIRQCNAFLRKFMVEQGYQSVEDFIGIAQQDIRYNEELHLIETIAELDEAKCTVCGVCADGLCIALSLNSGHIELDTEKCSGCGMCSIACTTGALKLVAKT